MLAYARPITKHMASTRLSWPITHRMASPTKSPPTHPFGTDMLCGRPAGSIPMISFNTMPLQRPEFRPAFAMCNKSRDNPIGWLGEYLSRVITPFLSEKHFSRGLIVVTL
jgi:hypothetical protein